MDQVVGRHLATDPVLPGAGDSDPGDRALSARAWASRCPRSATCSSPSPASRRSISAAPAITDFNEALKKLGRDQIMLCGIETHVCIYQTAFDLLRQGKQVAVAVDAVSSCSAANREIGLKRMREIGRPEHGRADDDVRDPEEGRHRAVQEGGPSPEGLGFRQRTGPPPEWRPCFDSAPIQVSRRIFPGARPSAGRESRCPRRRMLPCSLVQIEVDAPVVAGIHPGPEDDVDARIGQLAHGDGGRVGQDRLSFLARSLRISWPCRCPSRSRCP